MSHFPCLVIMRAGQSVGKLLEPYMENSAKEPPMEYMDFFEDEECEIDERTGKRGFWQNPNARWDWYVVGGRFSNQLKAKDGEWATGSQRIKGKYDIAMISDIDTTVDEREFELSLDMWNSWKRGTPTGRWELDHYKRDVVEERFPDAWMYARWRSEFWFHAVVTPDGKWHEVGKMLWWGISTETGADIRDWLDNFQSRFIKPFPDCAGVVVDCHI